MKATYQKQQRRVAVESKKKELHKKKISFVLAKQEAI